MTEYMSGYGTAVRDAVRVMPDGRKVTAIPARVQRCATGHMLQTNRPRVAAYARVSTDQEEQERSVIITASSSAAIPRGSMRDCTRMTAFQRPPLPDAKVSTA